MDLPTPTRTVEKLQTSLHAKAKTEPTYRFYTLWDKVCRKDVLDVAYQRCRQNGGAPGVDGESFEQIEGRGLEAWLGNLREELRAKTYHPNPLLRVWIPKRNGGQRPLGIPTVRDRVAQMAALLVLSPIFEADLLPQQYGFRPGLDAKMAVRRVFFHLTRHGRREVVDGDLSDYFNTIPHGALMKCVSRRVVDGQLLAVIKLWLRTPVRERKRRVYQQTTEAKDKHRGTPQGGVVSPLLSNLYFRRFLLAWSKFGLDAKLDACVVNYADDFVICCRPGNGTAALEAARQLMTRLGLQINERKTRLACLPEDRFDFLGYTFGRFYGKGGRPYIGTRPSKKAVSHVLQEIHDATSRRWLLMTPENRVKRLNLILRGWSGYFNQGPVVDIYLPVMRYTERRLRRWLMRKHKRRGTGYRQYPYEYLHEVLGLYKLPGSRLDVSKAKA
jgi:group II intron reverse transcriptase/maturase